MLQHLQVKSKPKQTKGGSTSFQWVCQLIPCIEKVYLLQCYLQL